MKVISDGLLQSKSTQSQVRTVVKIQGLVTLRVGPSNGAPRVARDPRYFARKISDMNQRMRRVTAGGNTF